MIEPEALGIEHLLAAAVISYNGELIINRNDLSSDTMENKVLSITLNDNETITIGLVDYDNN